MKKTVPSAPSVLLVSLVAFGALAGLARADDERSITIEKVDVDDQKTTTTLVVTGKVQNLPKGTQITGSLALAGHDGSYRRSPVLEDGTFTIKIGPIRKRVLPGEYTVKADFVLRNQPRHITAALSTERGAEVKVTPGLKKIRIGEVAEGEAEKKQFEQRYRELYEDARIAYLNVVMNGSYYTFAARPRAEGPWKPAAERWAARSERIKSGPMARVGRGVATIKDEVFQSYYPDAQAALESIAYLLPRLDAAYGAEIYKTLGMKVPPAIASLVQYDVVAVKENMHRHARALEASVGIEPEEWEPVDLGVREEGQILGEKYRSKVSKFEVERPAADWVFRPATSSPVTRLQIRPGDEKRGPLGQLVVEIHDHPRSEGDADLIEAIEVQGRDRWPAFKKIDSKKISAPDATMPGGVRPGYELSFKATLAGQVYLVREYHLFCRWKKRTYCLTSMAHEGEWKGFEKEFEASVKTFKVLDAETPIIEPGEGDD